MNNFARIMVGSTLTYLLVFSILSASTFHSVHAQIKKEKTIRSPDLLSVVVTIYGIKPTTDNILAFLVVKNSTKAQFFNASSFDKSDKNPSDGIVEVLLNSDMALEVGSEFKACVFVLNSQEVVCSIGHNSPTQRTEFVDISLNG